MKDPAIPTPEQIRGLPVTSVAVFRKALGDIGLTVKPGSRNHLRVTTSTDAFIGTVPSSPSDPRSLRNCRAWLARRVAEVRDAAALASTGK
ncbi:hypothetical protein Caci_3015 [Catenulispora acidiphila DSM 44928]|uniref:Uncharacterized protein n=1 Tax=Catenulispora acidiphila (strain DSM 44928 / JCM 14897 / NBRC 102108 / NRRL B-24433 / ID139908) TaxID=479433 RepID=C7Q4F5_CATAD|nr:hypothetical protein [Catenulispora acidiphila]ACU71924.1 hypothetical protein Caci_3015 [Catenulispora acidiphila DSM 44928]